MLSSVPPVHRVLVGRRGRRIADVPLAEVSVPQDRIVEDDDGRHGWQRGGMDA